MKKTLILSLITLLFCMCFTKVNAQVSSGVNLGVFKYFNNDAQLGFNLSGKYDINEKIRVGANLAYYFNTYEVFGTKMTAFTMPITALFEYSFINDVFSPYAGADVGIYRRGSGNGETSVGLSNFGLAPVVGLNYCISNELFINGNIKYHLIVSKSKSTSALGFNAGVIYKF